MTEHSARSLPLEGTFETLGEALVAAGEQFADREAYVDPDGRMSFGAWARRSALLATELARRGIGVGDVVAIRLPSSIDFAIAYTAAVQLGAIATGLNTRLGPVEFAGILERSRAAIVVGDPTPNDPVHTVPVLDRAELEKIVSRPGEVSVPQPGIRRSDPAIIIWTSGTTGMPKGAWYDHANLEAAVRSGGVMSAPFDRRLVATPFAHAGYMAKVWEQIAWGITFVVPPSPWSAPTTVDVLRSERITVNGGVPTQWAKILEQDLGEGTPFPAMRIGTAATAPASPALIEEVKHTLGVPLVVRYAMTESPSISGTEPDDPPEVQFSAVGRAQEGMEIRIADENDDDVPPDTVGSVRVRGACVMRGYWNDPERTAGAFDRDGWLRTGDLGRLGEDGLLVLTGRDSEMYIRGGYNVYPLEVERILSTHPGIRSIAVVGSPAPVIGEIGVAFVVPTDAAAPPTLGELRAFARERLADYKAPDELVVVEELPVTSMLKVDKRRLQSWCRRPGPEQGEQGTISSGIASARGNALS